MSWVTNSFYAIYLYIFTQNTNQRLVVSKFYTLLKNQFGANIKIFKSDNVKNYFNQTLTS